MSFKDILKKSFLENYAQTEMDAKTILITMAVTCLLAVYIYIAYRFIVKKNFYSKSFNVSLAALMIITAAIILTIQTSVVVSLGMVGALSIVRFRTAIKDPMDLIFLFWSIATGIICGAGLYGLAVVASLTVTVMIYVLDNIPQAKAPLILLVNYENDDAVSEKIESIIKDESSSYQEKSMTITAGQINAVYELRTLKGKELCRKLAEIDKVESVSVLKHDGEVTY